MDLGPLTDLRLVYSDVRVEVVHVDGSDPSLCYVACYVAGPNGQWGLLADWNVGPFADVQDGAVILRTLERTLAELLRV